MDTASPVTPCYRNTTRVFNPRKDEAKQSTLYKPYSKLNSVAHSSARRTSPNPSSFPTPLHHEPEEVSLHNVLPKHGVFHLVDEGFLTFLSPGMASHPILKLQPEWLSLGCLGESISNKAIHFNSYQNHQTKGMWLRKRSVSSLGRRNSPRGLGSAKQLTSEI